MTVDRWRGGNDYDAYIGRWSRPVAEAFVGWLAVPPGGRWLDLGCGTGALSATVLERAEPVSVVGVDPSADFVEAAALRVRDPRARFVVGTGTDLPLPDGSADIIVSGLVLNFIPDLGGAFREMLRVAAPHATIGAYVWDYAGRMELIRHFWDAAVALDPAAAGADEGVRFPICGPGPLRDAFVAAGLTDVEVRPIEVPTVFRDFDDYWTPFLSGVGPAPGYAARLDAAARTVLRERLRSALPARSDGTIALMARAWAASGRSSIA